METVVALGIGLLATTMIFYIFTLGLKNIQTIKNTESLHSNANFLLNTFTYWIKQGETFTVSPNTLEIGMHDSTTTITSNGKKIILNNTISGIAYLTDDSIGTTSLNFKGMAKSIQIGFILEAGEEKFLATTTIAQRSI